MYHEIYPLNRFEVHSPILSNWSPVHWWGECKPLAFLMII